MKNVVTVIIALGLWVLTYQLWHLQNVELWRFVIGAVTLSFAVAFLRQVRQ